MKYLFKFEFLYIQSLRNDSNLNIALYTNKLILIKEIKVIHGGLGHEMAVLVLILFANM